MRPRNPPGRNVTDGPSRFGVECLLTNTVCDTLIRDFKVDPDLVWYYIGDDLVSDPSRLSESLGRSLQVSPDRVERAVKKRLSEMTGVKGLGKMSMAGAVQACAGGKCILVGVCQLSDACRREERRLNGGAVD